RIKQRHQLCVARFFFQAEDGIRDRNVTGVQTCALPIYYSPIVPHTDVRRVVALAQSTGADLIALTGDYTTARASYVWPCAETLRSEERRVGKECRARWAPQDEQQSSRGDGRSRMSFQRR